MALIPLDEAAEKIGRDPRTLQRWIEAGKLDRYELDGDRRAYVDLEQALLVRGFRRSNRRRPSH